MQQPARKPCVGIAIDGVGYGTDGTVWGGEIFSGEIPHLTRVAHLQPVLMPGGDLATKFPERMLYGILPDEVTGTILKERGWSDIDLRVLGQQVAKRINTIQTTSTGRLLDAASALLGICRQKTYDGEPAMRLESAARGFKPQIWPLSVIKQDRCRVLDTPTLLRIVRDSYLKSEKDPDQIRTLASSFQYNLAGELLTSPLIAADEEGYSRVALSGGVAYNEAIRTTITNEIQARGTGTGHKYQISTGGWMHLLWAVCLGRND